MAKCLGIKTAGVIRREAEYQYQFENLPGKTHQKAWVCAGRSSEFCPPGRRDNHPVELNAEISGWAPAGWELGTHDVVVSWKGPGPSRSELRELCSGVGRVRFLILKGPFKDFVVNTAVVRFGTVQEARRASKEFDQTYWPQGSRFPDGTKLDVRWALAEEAWGGRPEWDHKNKADLSWKFAEYVPKHEEDSRYVMEAWKSNYDEKPIRRHGVPTLDWDHDQVACLNLRTNAGHESFVRASTDNPVYGPGPVYGSRPDYPRQGTKPLGPGAQFGSAPEGSHRQGIYMWSPARMSPEGHPRLRKNDGGPVVNAPACSRGEDELQLPWNLEIT